MQWFKQYVSLKENSKELVTTQERETIKHPPSGYESVHYHQFRDFVEINVTGHYPLKISSLTVLQCSLANPKNRDSKDAFLLTSPLAGFSFLLYIAEQ